jgi:hypothetical protein
LGCDHGSKRLRTTALLASCLSFPAFAIAGMLAGLLATFATA